MNEEGEAQGPETLGLKGLLREGKVTVQAELGFQVDVRRAQEVLRGHYDVSRLERDHKQMVDLITWLLSLPGMTIQAIAEASGMAWESVAAIQASQRKSIREFKLRAAEKLSLVLDASFGGLMKKAAEGKITAFDFKLLVDAWLQLSGEGHTMKFEGSKPEDPKRQAFRRFLEAGVPGMVLEGESIPQMAAQALPEAADLVPVPRVSLTGDSESLEIEAQTVDNQ